jgi:GntR family transcriptional repressor for pyruvate dehydrogenase complex
LFKPVQQKSQCVYTKVMSEIKSAIMHGLLKPGDKLPSERNLAEMLGVSRTSLREALKLLAAGGFVNIKHGQGVFITENDHESYLHKIFAESLATRDDLAGLFEIRKVLETQSAAWVAERAADEQILRMARLISTTKEKIAASPQLGVSLLVEQDSRFHLLLAEATGNKVMLQVMGNLLDLLTEVRGRSMAVKGRQLKSLHEHELIVNALIIRDKDSARQAMLDHLANVEADILL